MNHDIHVGVSSEIIVTLNNDVSFEVDGPAVRFITNDEIDRLSKLIARSNRAMLAKWLKNNDCDQGVIRCVTRSKIVVK